MKKNLKIFYFFGIFGFPYVGVYMEAKKTLPRQLNKPVNRICEASGLSDDSGRNSVPMEKGAKVLSKENRQADHQPQAVKGSLLDASQTALNEEGL